MCWCVCVFGLCGPPSAGPDRFLAGQPKISLFFPLSPSFSFFFSLSLGGFSWNFGGVFEGRETLMCTFGLSGCRPFFPRGSEEHSEIPDYEDSKTASFRGCIREADQGQRPSDEDQACSSSFGRFRRSRSRWFAGSVEARRDSSPGCAH